MSNQLPEIKLGDRVEHIRTGDKGTYQGVDPDTPSMAWVLWDDTAQPSILNLSYIALNNEDADEDQAYADYMQSIQADIAAVQQLDLEMTDDEYRDWLHSHGAL